MTRKLLISIVLTGLFASIASAEDERLQKLSEDERAWLEEEVVYIITKAEREVYLNLGTKQERDLFVDAFWARRDPNPATLENEFKIEHYERLAYANRVLGRESTRPGWKTDRGRFYIILGPPADLQRYDGLNEVVSCELWLYNGDTSLGQPARFNLLFYKDNNIGEYELYHPSGDGPEALLTIGDAIFRTNQNLAVDQLEMVSVDLAKAALTVDLSEPTAQMFSARNTRDPQLLQVRPSMNADRNLVEIAESPLKKVDTDYLDGYMRYGNRVSADYSFNYVSNRSFFAVLAGPDDTPFIHYSIELDPDNLSLESSEDGTEFYTTLSASLELRDLDGRLLAITENEPFLRLTASQFEQAKAFPFAYRDSFPVLPGDYQVSIVLRNRATRQYTVAETQLSVPEIGSMVSKLGELVLASSVERTLSEEADTHKTFQLGPLEMDPSVEGVFAVNSTIHAVTQVVHGSAGEKVRIVLRRGDEMMHEAETVLTSEDAVTGAVTAPLPLLKLEPGSYTVVAELYDPSGSLVDSTSRDVTLSPRTAIPRPAFVYRHSFSSDVPGLLDMTLGEQLMTRGRIDEAEKRLRAAVAAGNSDLDMARWKLASALLFKREADEALDLLTPLENRYPDQVEVVEGLGFSYYIKESYAKALDYLEHARTLRPADTSLLNAIGDCYERLSNVAKAREAYEESLGLNPQQEGVKARLAGLSSGE